METEEDIEEEQMEEDGEAEPTKTRGGKNPEPIETLEEEGGRKNNSGSESASSSDNNRTQDLE